MDIQNDKLPYTFAHKRRIARLSAVQALYKIDIVGCSAECVINEYEMHRFSTDTDDAEDIYDQVDLDWFRLIVCGVKDNITHIDNLISSCLTEGWSLSRLDLIVCSILRSGLFELISCSSVPVEVVISEYISISSAFFYKNETNFINAVLDSLSRMPEVNRRGKELNKNS
ncbi:transcription antitermination factor NusB [Candidatus Liberibacter americanus]|uniref:Transcription antitermination protein NusB n=1 Tax=Candidatus Liberibacter americanus str. Sao Paulo TaxID=1261131 RepID=U6B538_9HYPH|nr:transcription antitermination factor NusB [Candidatus Liberibacter americanus]AHA27703.1 Transcription termination factor [Candidatus Liberibacter americanus str. Sao Paulo]EMS36410.1 transcription antitermination protein NusB [Candidatus Liberibacter americanus PW_SP]